MNKDRLMEVSMNILINSGEARNLIKEAYDCILNGSYENYDNKLKEAHEFILKAHKSQTGEIQKEANGEDFEYSILFSHAQDTMMTINSELITAKKLGKIFKNFNERLRKLEEINE